MAEKTSTINRLTKMIKEAQNQCAEMVLESHPPRQREEEILRAQGFESDVKRLQNRNRELRTELDATRRELSSRGHHPELSFRSLLKKEAWEEEKRALESHCKRLEADMSSQRSSNRREIAKLVSSHKNQLETVKRKIQLFQTRVERLTRAQTMSKRVIRELKEVLDTKGEENFEKRLEEHVASLEDEWKAEWKRSVSIRDGKWKDAHHKATDELKQNYHAQINDLKRELDARNAEIAAATQEFQKLEKEFYQSLKKPLELPQAQKFTASEEISMMSSTISTFAVEDTLRRQLEDRTCELHETKRKLAEEKALFRATITEWLTQVEVLKTVKLREAEVIEARLGRHKQREKDLREKLKLYKRQFKEHKYKPLKPEPLPIAEPSPQRAEDLRQQLRMKVSEFLCNLDKYE